jgi:UDP-N-acetylmuramate dehydrogenase|tara:strand:- start:2061 stop:2936 length:876 start_codon:yes stop_codon:yes gene_type:complete
MKKNTIYNNISLKKYNSWKVGGVADKLYICADKDLLSENIILKKITPPFIFIGLGSNLLIRDGGVKGTVIIMHGGLSEIKFENNYFYAEAGVSCSKLAKFIARNSFIHSAFLAGIPGTIGGALSMNAGCYGSETWDFVESVLVVDEEGKQFKRAKNEYTTQYRQVTSKLNVKEYFLAAWMKFPRGLKEDAEDDIRSLLKRRKETQPLNWPTAGSTFRNPPNHFAAQLIEECGLKGFTIGGAQISKKHANFIINLGDASALDIEELISYTIKRVLEITNIFLETEIKIIGEY